MQNSTETTSSHCIRRHQQKWGIYINDEEKE